MDTKFYPQEEGINKFLNLIKKFGKISDSNKLESNLKNDENLLDESNKSYKLKKTISEMALIPALKLLEVSENLCFLNIFTTTLLDSVFENNI